MIWGISREFWVFREPSFNLTNFSIMHILMSNHDGKITFCNLESRDFVYVGVWRFSRVCVTFRTYIIQGLQNLMGVVVFF